jgi:hypothetical protein
MENKYSQSGEELVIIKLIEEFPNINRICVEFGAYDGLLNSNTKRLEELGWKRFLFDSIPYGGVICCKLTAENICDIFKQHNIPKDMGFLSIDIDSNDYYILEKLLQNEYKPSIICIEYNSEFEPNESYTIKYDADMVWDNTPNYGASAFAISRLLKRNDYQVRSYCGVNVIAVKNPNVPARHKGHAGRLDLSKFRRV